MWFLMALLVVGLGVLLSWLLNRGIKLTWYEWLMGTAGFLLVIGAIQHYFASLSEGVPTAAWMGALVLVIPALILLAVAWQLVARRQRHQNV